jgi:hypothetical protein
MRKYARAALVASLMMSTASATALFATTSIVQAAEKISRAVGVPFNDAVKAMQTKDWQTALVKLKEADAAPNKNDFEQYNINKVFGIVYINMNDLTSATPYYLAAADSPAMPPEDKKDIWSGAAQLAGRAKMYDKAVYYAKGIEALGAMDDRMAANTAIAYYNLKDFANAKVYAQKAVDLAKAAGKQPDENALLIVMNAQVNQKDQSGALQTLEQMAVDYNSPDSWQQLTELAINAKGVPLPDELFLFRLRMVTGAMKDYVDFESYGTLCNQLGYPAEGKSVLEQGISAGKITSGQAGSILSKARNDAVGDQKTLNQTMASAKASKAGEQDIKLAEDLYGYGRYAEAEEAARRGIGKGGIKDASEGQLILGASLLAQGKFDDANATFGQISGTETRKKTAHLWSLYAQAKKKLAAASTTPAH